MFEQLKNPILENSEKCLNPQKMIILRFKDDTWGVHCAYIIGAPSP